MQVSFTLRPFKSTDLDQVMNINRRSLPENYSTYFFLDLHERFPATFLVAEDKGLIAGYIMCRIETGAPDFGLLGFTKKGHVISIAVLPEYRRQGIAYALMKEAMGAMLRLKAKECFLEVRVSNTPAVKLYQKMGFKVTRTIQGYYANGEAAYKMTRKLPFED